MRAIVFRSLVSAVFAGLSLLAASDAGAAQQQELRYQGWTSKVLYPELAEDLGYLAPLKLKWVGNTNSGPQDIQAAVTGDVDFGGAFNGSIVKLVAAHAPIKAVIAYVGTDQETNGGLFVTNDSDIKTARDLVGRKIGVNTLGAYEQYVVTAYLEKSGVSRDDIEKITFVPAPPVNLAQLLRQKQLDAIFLEDIIKDKLLAEGGARLLTTDYAQLGSAGYASYILTDRFIKQNPDSAQIRGGYGTGDRVGAENTACRSRAAARKNCPGTQPQRGQDNRALLEVGGRRWYGRLDPPNGILDLCGLV